MDCSRLIASIVTALDCLQSQKDQHTIFTIFDGLDTTIHGLRVVRTFLLCSATLSNNVELRPEDNNGNAISNPLSRKRKMKKKKRRMRKSLGSFMVKVEYVVRTILDDHIPFEPCDIKAFEEEMNKWYKCLLDYLQQYSTSPVGNQIKVIADSVLESLKDCSSKISMDKQSEKEMQKVEALEKDIAFVRDFIRFGTLFSAENQEFQYLLAQVEPLVISAAHLVLYLYSNNEGIIYVHNDLTSSMISALLLKIHNPLLHERYTLALKSLKHSQRLCYRTLGLNDDPFIIIMEDFTGSLLSTLWEMLQLATHHLVPLKGKVQELSEGLRFLRTLVKKQPEKFDDYKIRDTAAAAIFDAGVIIFSLYQKDFFIDDGFQCYQDNIEIIRAEILEEPVIKTPRFNYFVTNILGFLDFLLEDYLTEVKSSSFVPIIREHLGFLKSFIGVLGELRNQQESLHQDLWDLAVEVVYKIELLIDQLVLTDIPDSFSRSLQSTTENIMILKADSLKILNDEGRQEISKVHQIPLPSPDEVLPISSISSRLVADDIVGFESEKASIVNRIITGFKKLQVVAVIGMPGLGKTTLATKVYSTPSISHYFHVKAWCSISQVFDRKKALLELLNQIQPGESNMTKNEDDLSQQLWRSLKRRKYLIFIDDIWDTEAFSLLKESLPDDSNQSRILLTSRNGDVVPEALLDDKPLFLRHLTVDESLELLQRKLFPAQNVWPAALHDFGVEIAAYCKGLPLTVVIIAGLIRTTEQEGWKDILNTLRSSIITDQCISTIELSYKHLPDHLKPCFLWFGAFPEDHEFSVKKLIWLWIAEGLVRKSAALSLEDTAADYLNNLIRRSLVMRVKERTTGGVKACRIHDLLHDFCLKKAKEDYFFHLIKVKENGEQGHMSSDEFEISSFDEPELYSGEADNPRRLCIYSKCYYPQNYKFFFPSLRSLLFFARVRYRYPDLPFIFRIHKLLRVLDMEQVYPRELPSEVGLLLQLRYLAVQVDRYVCPAIGKLSNLETLILKAVGLVEGLVGRFVSLPDTLWNLQKLRHLYSKGSLIELPIDNSDSSCILLELETLSTLSVSGWSVMEKQLRKFPNIRQLKCYLSKDGIVNHSKVRDFSFLSQLEPLSLSYVNYDTVF